MKQLLVEILADGMVIGVARLVPSDPSMGVASGIFEPSLGYSKDRHARAAEAWDRDAAPATLLARTIGGVQLECAGVDLVDFSESCGTGGRELSLLGLEGFATFFE